MPPVASVIMNVGSNAQKRCSTPINRQRGVTRTNFVRPSETSLTRGSRKVRSFSTQLRGFVMSRRSTSIKIATKAGILFGALFLVTVLIAAIPAHQQRTLEVVVAPEQQPSQDSSAQSQSADHSSMPGMNMDEKVSERAAVNDM